LQLSDRAVTRLTWVLIPGKGRVHFTICLHSVVCNIRQLFSYLFHYVQDLKFSQQWWWGFELSGIWHCVTGYVVPTFWRIPLPSSSRVISPWRYYP